ncbi:2Fe-2S iron-sulfur cluster-binding protein [Undibacterium sp. Ren11W]|uniref:2Fe-2S iron-sulfur cluster-binding protein n=1 Tax=Undibacterium sp. Ren11W TaxID=3413045 RepID=UPI003BF01AF8
MTKKGISAKLSSQGWQFPMSEGVTILDAALDAGVRLPSSCRNGSCRTCMCKLLSGAVQYQIDWPGLSLDEKTEGWILPCVAFGLSDLILDVPYGTRISV